MKSKIKNILIFTGITVALVAGYLLFIKKDPEPENLVSYTAPENLNPTNSILPSSSNEPSMSTRKNFNKDLLPLLLSVKNIRLDDSIFSDAAFILLRDSSITLSPPTDEGRPNPFAPIGYDAQPVFSEVNLSADASSSIQVPNSITDSDLEELENLLNF